MLINHFNQQNQLNLTQGRTSIASWMSTNLLLGYMDEYIPLVETLDVIYPDSKI